MVSPAEIFMLNKAQKSVQNLSFFISSTCKTNASFPKQMRVSLRMSTRHNKKQQDTRCVNLEDRINFKSKQKQTKSNLSSPSIFSS